MVLGHADYHYRHEPIAYGYTQGSGRRGRGAKGWYGGNSQCSVIEVPRPAASRDHPTMKPVELIRRCLLNSSKEGFRVLDPFCGSGSTLVACELMGRRGYGMEIEPSYCDVAVARFEALTGEKASLEAEGESSGTLGRGNEQLVEGPHGLGLHRGKHVGVEIKRHPDARVAQALRDDLGVDPL